MPSSQKIEAIRIGMKLVIVVPGVLVAVAGTVFIFQSLGQVGPSSSFMYQNPSWTTYRWIIASVGVARTLFGVIVSRKQ